MMSLETVNIGLAWTACAMALASLIGWLVATHGDEVREPMLNVQARRIGGLTFIKIGRLNLSFSVSRAYRPIGG